MHPTIRKILNKLKQWLRHAKEGLKGLYWSIYGTRLRNPEKLRDVKSILFVCKGNICRSPFAEFLVARFNEGGSGNIMVFSAGIEANKPNSSPPEAVAAAERFAVDLRRHRSKGITLRTMKFCDMIVAMEAAHFRHLRKKFPQYREKIILLPLFDRGSNDGQPAYLHYNIPDPFGLSPDAIACYKKI